MAKWMDTLEMIVGAAYEVETNDCGTCIVPEEVCGRAPGVTKKRREEQLPDEITWMAEDAGFEAVRDHVAEYVEGKRVYQITRKHGVCWRMTEPGYMDCTEWSLADSEEEVKEQAMELYGHGEEE